jgi:hypothetical protein
VLSVSILKWFRVIIVEGCGVLYLRNVRDENVGIVDFTV